MTMMMMNKFSVICTHPRIIVMIHVTYKPMLRVLCYIIPAFCIFVVIFRPHFLQHPLNSWSFDNFSPNLPNLCYSSLYLEFNNTIRTIYCIYIYLYQHIYFFFFISNSEIPTSCIYSHLWFPPSVYIIALNTLIISPTFAIGIDFSIPIRVLPRRAAFWWLKIVQTGEKNYKAMLK